MSEPKPPHDVALSFKWVDQNVAQCLYEALSPTLNVFYIPRKQEDVASRDGVKTMREPFLNARLSVVLYRPPWGEDGWTETERGGIYDGCLAKGRGWKHLMVVNMDGRHPAPDTIPNHRMRFNLGEFSIDELVGAIKSTVLELGGELQPMTVAKRAEIHKANAKYEDDRKRFRSTSDGLIVFQEELEKLCAQIREKANGLKNAGIDVEHRSLTARSGIEYGSLTARFGGRCGIRQRDIGMIVFWRYQGSLGIDQETLVIEEYNRHIILPTEPRVYLDGRGPMPIRAFRYELELSRSREPVWKRQNDGEVYSTSTLAEAVMIRFLSLIDDETEAANRAPRQ